MINPKLDNHPYDRGHIAIHNDFSPTEDGRWFFSFVENMYYSEESYRWHLAQAQESVDDIICDLVNLK